MRERDKEKNFLNLQNIKKIIKNFCPPILWSYLNNLKHKSLKYKSINNLDKKIESYVNFNNGYFDDWHKRILKEDFNNFCKKYRT